MIKMFLVTLANILPKMFHFPRKIGSKETPVGYYAYYPFSSELVTLNQLKVDSHISGVSVLCPLSPPVSI